MTVVLLLCVSLSFWLFFASYTPHLLDWHTNPIMGILFNTAALLMNNKLNMWKTNNYIPEASVISERYWVFDICNAMLCILTRPVPSDLEREWALTNLGVELCSLRDWLGIVCRDRVEPLRLRPSSSICSPDGPGEGV